MANEPGKPVPFLAMALVGGFGVLLVLVYIMGGGGAREAKASGVATRAMVTHAKSDGGSATESNSLKISFRTKDGKTINATVAVTDEIYSSAMRDYLAGKGVTIPIKYLADDPDAIYVEGVSTRQIGVLIGGIFFIIVAGIIFGLSRLAGVSDDDDDGVGEELIKS